jgi:hypothetical protein
MNRPRLALLLLVQLAFSLAGCSQTSQPVEVPTMSTTPTGPAQPMEIVEVPEIQPYRDALLKGDPGVTWAESSACAAQVDTESRRNLAREAIRSSAGALATADYSALSLPLYTDVTRSFKLKPSDFTGDNTALDSCGTVGGSTKWAIYRWRGPDIPQLPNRQMVFRWIQVYALVDLEQEKVARLATTVRGEVHE